MDTPSNSTVMKASIDADLLQGRRIKGPPTRPNFDHPERTSLLDRDLLGDGRSTHRLDVELSGRKQEPAAAVVHSRCNTNK